MPIRSLSARITLGILLLTLTFIGLTATLAQREFSKHLEQAEHRALISSVRGLSHHFRADILEHLQHDLVVASRLPALLDLANNGESEPTLSRAARGIASFHATNSNYGRIQIIGTRGTGRLILDTRSEAEALAKVGAGGSAPDARNTPYFRIGSALEPGQVYLGSITLKREAGKVIEPHWPVMHAVTPIFDRDDRRYAVMIVELDMRMVFDNLRASMLDGQALYMFDEDGYCLTAPQKLVCSYGFEFPGNAADPEMPKLLPALHQRLIGSEAMIFDVRDIANERHDVIVGATRIPFDADKTSRRLTLVVTAPYAQMQTSAATARATLMPMLIVVALVTLVLALLAVLTLTRPLRRMTESVQAFAESGTDLPLPIDEKNEIGTLACAFANMRDEVRNRSRMEAEKRVREAELEATAAAERKAREALETALARAEAGERAKSEFLATMSHEIRTPMNGILGMAQLLRQTELTTEQTEYLDTLLQSGNSLLAILNDILDYSRIEAGQIDLVAATFDLEQTILEIAQLMAASAEEKRLVIRTTYQEGCPRQIVADAQRIRQVLLNLMNNAVKFTHDGHIEISVALAPDNTSAAPCLLLAVRDTGIGIDAQMQKSLFDSFTQADGSATRAFGGTGLGLAISKQIVEMMGGTIGFTSELKLGSTFWFTLPIEPAEEAVSPATSGIPELPTGEPVLDCKMLDTLHRQFGEDLALLISTFIESTPSLIDELAAAIAVSDVETTRRHAHSLKSSAATFGAKRLTSLARSLDQAVMANAWMQSAEIAALLQGEFAITAAKLRDCLEAA